MEDPNGSLASVTWKRMLRMMHSFEIGVIFDGIVLFTLDYTCKVRGCGVEKLDSGAELHQPSVHPLV